MKALSASLRNVTRLHLACSRYLTDTLFSRIISVVGPLKKLSLAGCQISFHEAIHKRFYPEDGRVTMSDHVLTFKHILKYIEEKAGTLKEISLGRTLVDSEGLYSLSKVPNLQLESVHLMSCDQLTKSGIQLLCENQKAITDLDLSLCSRLTDYAVLAVCQHLPHLKKLNLRRCQGVTEVQSYYSTVKNGFWSVHKYGLVMQAVHCKLAPKISFSEIFMTEVFILIFLDYTSDRRMDLGNNAVLKPSRQSDKFCSLMNRMASGT